MQPTQADNEIEEEQLHNFVVNSLEKDFVGSRGQVEVTAETLYEILIGGTSINHVYETTDESPNVNTVRGHLIDQFELIGWRGLKTRCFNEISLRHFQTDRARHPLLAPLTCHNRLPPLHRPPRRQFRFSSR